MEDIALYLEAAEGTGMRLRYVIDTHLQADHISSGRDLAEAAGAEYVFNNKAFMIDDEDEFVCIMIADVPPPPPDAPRTRALNSGQTAATSA